jgi:hypothetical protein
MKNNKVSETANIVDKHVDKKIAVPEKPENEATNKLIGSIRLQTQIYLNSILPIMRELTKDDNYIVDEVAYIATVPKTTVLEWLRNETLSLIKEAESVKNEIDLFHKALNKSEESLEKGIKNYPFLANIWYGDEYDGKEGNEALQILLSELKKDTENATDDKIIEMATTHFTNIKK